MHTCGVKDKDENFCQINLINQIKNDGIAKYCEKNPPLSVCPTPCEQMTYVTDMTFRYPNNGLSESEHIKIT